MSDKSGTAMKEKKDREGLDAIIRRLKKLEDRVEIESVLRRYCRASDWLDADMLDDVIFDDADIDYGFFKGNGKDFKRVLMEVDSDVARRWHLTAQVSIEVGDDVAEVQSYQVTLSSESINPEPNSLITQYHGYYIDRLVRRNDRWGIVSRKHLLTAVTEISEVPLVGVFEELNEIGSLSTKHSSYRNFKRGA